MAHMFYSSRDRLRPYNLTRCHGGLPSWKKFVSDCTLARVLCCEYLYGRGVPGGSKKKYTICRDPGAHRTSDDGAVGVFFITETKRMVPLGSMIIFRR